MDKAVLEFIEVSSQNHVILYNNKIVDMGYESNQKQQFALGCMRINDNLGTGNTPTSIGYIKTPSRLFYRISRAIRSAKKIKQSEIQ